MIINYADKSFIESDTFICNEGSGLNKSNKCELCPVNTYAYDNKCVDCPYNTYSLAGSTACYCMKNNNIQSNKPNNSIGATGPSTNRPINAIVPGITGPGTTPITDIIVPGITGPGTTPITDTINDIVGPITDITGGVTGPMFLDLSGPTASPGLVGPSDHYVNPTNNSRLTTEDINNFCNLLLNSSDIAVSSSLYHYMCDNPYDYLNTLNYYVVK